MVVVAIAVEVNWRKLRQWKERFWIFGRHFATCSVRKIEKMLTFGPRAYKISSHY